MSYARSLSALVCAAVGAATSSVCGNLIVNGSFEEGPDLGELDAVRLSNGSTEITGWTVTRTNLDVIGSSIWLASDGDRSLDMSGDAQGGIAQTIPTTPGVVYNLVFDMAGNFAGGDPVKDLIVRAEAGLDLQFEAFSFDSTGQSANNMGWQTMTWEFTAAGDSTTIEFVDLEANGFGAALDNVMVTAIPGPGALALLVGFGLRRRRGR